MSDLVSRPLNNGRSVKPLAAVPVVDVLARLIFLKTITLMNIAFELVAFAIDDVEVIVGERALLFLDLSLHLFPVTFDAVPIHCGFLHRSL